MRMLIGTESLMPWTPLHSDTDILNMNSFRINSILSFSPAFSCCSTWLYWPLQEWIYIDNWLHFFLFVLNRGQSNLLKCYLHTLAVFGTRGQMFDSGMFFQKLSDTWFFNFSLFLTIYLVSDKDEGEFFWLFRCSLIEELCDPGLDVFEGLNQSERTLLFVIS